MEIPGTGPRGNSHRFVAAAFAILVSCSGLSASSPEATLESAEKHYAAGRYAQAHRAYGALKARHPGAAEEVWIDFRLADTLWRAQIAKKPPDDRVIDSARESLETQLRGLPSPDARTRMFAELNESLAELWLERPQRGPSWDYPQRARPYLAAARKWWLEHPGEPDRNARFLALFWLSQKQMETKLPVDEIREAVSLARSDEERAHAHLLIATALAEGFQPQVEGVIGEYEAALAIGRTKWRRNLLFAYAEFMRYCGKPEPGTGVRVECKPDNERALALFATLKDDLARDGSDAGWEVEVDREIAKIAGPLAVLWVPGAFLAGQPIELTLRQRNLTHCELALYPLRAPEDFHRDPDAPSTNEFRWIATIPLDGVTPIGQWTQTVSDRRYEDLQEEVRLNPLGPGLYVLQLKSDAGESRWPLLVSDLSLLFTRVGNRSSLFVTRTVDGAGVAHADVTMFRTAGQPVWIPTSTRTDPHGLVVLPDGAPEDLYVAKKDSDVALLSADTQPEVTFLDVNVHAWTPKSTYRPGETVIVSFLARSWTGFVTDGPGRSLAYDICLGQSTVSSSVVSFDEFGRGQTSFPLSGGAASGTYRIRFPGLAPPNSRPEERFLFRVAEKPPSALRVGVVASIRPATPVHGSSSVEALVNVERSGEPLAGAAVELRSFRRSFSPGVIERRVDHHTLQAWSPLTGTTDASGRVTLSFPAQMYPACNLEYELEAVASGPENEKGFGYARVRDENAPFAMRLTLDKSVARTGETISLRVRTFDGKGNPVGLHGTVTGRRFVWTEAWTSPDGRLIQGDDLRRLKARAGPFPPYGPQGVGTLWKVAAQTWNRETVFSAPVDTSPAGVAEVRIAMARPGQIQLRFEGSPVRPDPPTIGKGPEQELEPDQGATLWIVDEKTLDLDYQPESLEIHLPKATARPGEDVSALLVTPLRNRDVLLSVFDRSGARNRIVHIDGNAGVVSLHFPEDGSERLSIAAAMVSEGFVLHCQKDLAIEPDWGRLRIDVAAASHPASGQTTTLRLVDHEGRAVRGEVSVALVAGENEPLRDPLQDLLTHPNLRIDRQTSLSRWSLVGSGAGPSASVIQPPCGRSKPWVFSEGDPPTCEPRLPDYRRDDSQGSWSLESEVPQVLFQTSALPTDDEGRVTFHLPECPAPSACSLRVWASGLGYTLGFLETDVSKILKAPEGN